RPPHATLFPSTTLFRSASYVPWHHVYGQGHRCRHRYRLDAANLRIIVLRSQSLHGGRLAMSRIKGTNGAPATTLVQRAAQERGRSEEHTSEVQSPDHLV